MLAWAPTLSVEIREIDDQHKELFARVNRLFEAMDRGYGRQEVDRLLDFLADYVMEHFGTEERYMVRYQYPARHAHAAEHEEFKTSMARLKGRIDSEAATLGLLMELFRRMGDWLLNHVNRTDMAMGAYLKLKM